MYEVKVYVTLKEGVLDPQGTAVKNSLDHLGFEGIEEVRIGKVMTLMIDETAQSVNEQVEAMCEKLLANPVIEDYRYEIKESARS
ncbi:phosphoribosylformylglycinamidine synthase subunit PurS [Bacillus shivajii]|uniref:phosphoribosylformylglycinamidine synthase subunit PurS n=1 Tax=Bacillus shivajii TaxID=1983719 RepID=UPI001CF9EF85|nr:phosphoribosylformylglycinamidine synthase subunit PurS [Bacillus shivajii]UCZ53788.1 phosphoribosylformylglycinamidine synthase subunit PurS [Bacillus shivajii]